MERDEYTELFRYLVQIAKPSTGLVTAIEDLGIPTTRIKARVAGMLRHVENGREA